MDYSVNLPKSIKKAIEKEEKEGFTPENLSYVRYNDHYSFNREYFGKKIDFLDCYNGIEVIHFYTYIGYVKCLFKGRLIRINVYHSYFNEAIELKRARINLYCVAI